MHFNVTDFISSCRHHMHSYCDLYIPFPYSINIFPEGQLFSFHDRYTHVSWWFAIKHRVQAIFKNICNTTHSINDIGKLLLDDFCRHICWQHHLVFTFRISMHISLACGFKAGSDKSFDILFSLGQNHKLDSWTGHLVRINIRMLSYQPTYSHYNFRIGSLYPERFFYIEKDPHFPTQELVSWGLIQLVACRLFGTNWADMDWLDPWEQT